MKKILITGANSYIGTRIKDWLGNYPDRYSIELISLKNDSWKKKDFSGYDVLIHLAAVVHKKEKPEMKSLYLEVNRDLPIEVAKRAEAAGVKHFIFMSTMAVYGEEGKIGRRVVINRDTKPNPNTFYGNSKLEAEIEISKFRSDNFNILSIRPPIVYGPSCPGNYTKLEKLAKRIPVFPMVMNERSMLHIDKLCHEIKQYIDEKTDGVVWPQDDEYMNTSLLVKRLAEQNGRKIVLSKSMGWIVEIIGKRSSFINKVFGNLVYER